MFWERAMLPIICRCCGSVISARASWNPNPIGITTVGGGGQWGRSAGWVNNVLGEGNASDYLPVLWVGYFSASVVESESDRNNYCRWWRPVGPVGWVG